MPLQRYFNPPKNKSYFVFGPRGTGKSTWVKATYETATIIDLLEPDTFRNYHSFPERLQELVEAHTGTTIFVVDEVQKVPELLSVVHKLIEMKQGWQFILTGLSSRKLKRSGVDLLVGRAQLKFMHPFMASEIGEEFALEKNLRFGMLPLVLDSDYPKEDLKTYIALYLREEVQAESLVRQVDEFGRFLEIISFSQGCVLNYSNISRECAVSSKSIENYVSILEDLLIGVRINVFDKKSKRELTSHPKFYYFDAGVYQSIRPKGPLDDHSSITGVAIETIVMQHLRAWIDYSSDDGRLYFWRTRGGLEVDFVVYGEIGFYAIEVKKTATIKPSDLRGLYEFRNDFPEANAILLYMGTERLRKKDILCLPVKEFLCGLKPDEPIY